MSGHAPESAATSAAQLVEDACVRRRRHGSLATTPMIFASRSGSSRSARRRAVIDDAALVQHHACASENSSATRLFCSTRMIDSALSPRSLSSTAVSVSTITGASPSVGSSISSTRRIGQQRARDRQHLLLAAGELVARVVEPLLAACGNSSNTRSRVQWPGRAATSRFSRTRQRGKDLALLRHEADAGQRAAIDRHAVEAACRRAAPRPCAGWCGP